MEGILIIAVWAVVIITAIIGFYQWYKIRNLVKDNNISENTQKIKNEYGYIKIILSFILLGLFVIFIVSILEATQSGGYFNF